MSTLSNMPNCRWSRFWQFNFDSTYRIRFRYAKGGLITFCFTRVSCDTQICQLINDIKCASALAACVTLCHSAAVINIRIFDLKPLHTFLHDFIIESLSSRRSPFTEVNQNWNCINLAHYACHTAVVVCRGGLQWTFPTRADSPRPSYSMASCDNKDRDKSS